MVDDTVYNRSYFPLRTVFLNNLYLNFLIKGEQNILFVVYVLKICRWELIVTST